MGEGGNKSITETIHHITDFFWNVLPDNGPILLQGPEDTIYDTFSNVHQVSLTCSVTGDQPLTYKWLFNGNEVDPSADRYTIANGQLTIQNPDRQVDQGEYVCQATNDVGTIRSLPANLVFACKCCPIECTTFVPVIFAPMVNANVKHNTNINPNSNPNLIPYPTLNQNANHYPHSNSLLLEISSQEQLSPKQMLDHRPITYGKGATW